MITYIFYKDVDSENNIEQKQQYTIEKSLRTHWIKKYKGVTPVEKFNELYTAIFEDLKDEKLFKYLSESEKDKHIERMINQNDDYLWLNNNYESHLMRDVELVEVDLAESEDYKRVESIINSLHSMKNSRIVLKTIEQHLDHQLKSGLTPKLFLDLFKNLH